MRDAAALRGVVDRLGRVELDLAQDAQEYRDYLAGKDDAKKLGELKQAVARARETLSAAERKKGGTYAAAVADYVRAKMAADVLGEPADPDELVTLAERADAAARSDGSGTTLRTALAFRAHARLVRTVPGYAEAAKATARTLGPILLDLVLLEGGPLAEKAAADPDVKRRRELLRAEVEKWPANFGPASWAVLVGWDAKAAGRIAERAKADDTEQLSRAVERKTAPFNVSVAVREYMALRMAGKTTEASAVLKELAAQGIRLPLGK